MPKYVIHIGPPKTGSKFLQSQLYYARKDLLVADVVYPGNWWKHTDEVMHLSLFQEIRNGQAQSLNLEFAKINARDPRIVVLSSEGFESLDEDRLMLLRNAIGNHPIEIVYYCRAWSSRIPSLWRMRVMTGEFQTFPEFFLFYAAEPSGSGEINYARVWSHFENVFGRKSLKLVSFSNLERNNVDLFDHFCRTFLGLAQAPMIKTCLIQKNISPPMQEMEIIRALNALHFHRTGERGLIMRVKFLAVRNRLELAPLLEMMANSWGSFHVRDHAEPLNSAWKAISAYTDCLVSKEYGHHIFDRDSRLLAYVQPHYLLMEGALEELIGLYRALVSFPVDDPQLRRGHQIESSVVT
jgi:hypothetical protein